MGGYKWDGEGEGKGGGWGNGEEGEGGNSECKPALLHCIKELRILLEYCTVYP